MTCPLDPSVSRLYTIYLGAKVRIIIVSSKLFSQYIRAYVFFNCLTTIIGGEAKIIYQSVQGPMGPVLVSSKTRRNTAGQF